MGKYSFGVQSSINLEQCCFDLQYVMNNAIAMDLMDFSITEGYRGKARQNRFFDIGKSRVKWPDGKHNSIPSKAVDAVPYINNKSSYNKLHCCVLAGIILATAKKLGIEIRWGGNWDQDGEPVTDQGFQDLVHYEVLDGKTKNID